jgi:broad specificity phosphatase PhoE
VGRTDAELTQKRDGAGVVRAAAAGDRVLVLRTSPLSRARDTAALLAIDVPVEVDERWVEVDYGEYECQPLSDIPADIWRQWQRDPGFSPGRR